jgi:hypothetical protein
MTEEFLNGPEVVAAFDEMGGERMSIMPGPA